MAIQKIADIPTEAEADEVVATFKAIGCDPVEKVKQSDGKWTVHVITCPSPKASHSTRYFINANLYFRTDIVR